MRRSGEKANMPDAPAIVERIDFATYKADMDALGREASAAVQEVLRQKDELYRVLIAAAISTHGDLCIHDGAMARVDLYEVITFRDEANACLKIRVRPKEVPSALTGKTPTQEHNEWDALRTIARAMATSPPSANEPCPDPGQASA
jgi:hypothetical protein